MNVARQREWQQKRQRNGKNEQTNNSMSHNDESFVMFDVPAGASS